MLSLFKTYFLMLAHPYRFHDYLKHSIPLPGREEDVVVPLTYSESILISWLWVIVRAFFEVIFLISFSHIVFSAADDATIINSWIKEILPDSIPIMWIVLGALFFPVLTTLLNLVWGGIIALISMLWVKDTDKWDALQDTFAVAMTTSVFTLIPIIGDVIFTLGRAYFIYIGLRKRWNLGRLASLLLVMSPLLLLTSVTLFCILFLTLIFNSAW